jgi:hypothetical protein
MIAIDTKALRRSYLAAARSNKSLSASCAEMAATLFTQLDKAADPASEFKRLQVVAVTTLRGMKIDPDKNVMRRAYEYLLVLMAPDMPIEVAPGKGDNGPVLTPAKQMTGTTRALQEAAKQIRCAIGVSDGRAGNKQPAKPTGAIDEAALAALVKADVAAGVAALTRVLARYGYGVEKIRKTAKPRPAPRAAKAVPAPAPAPAGESLSA